MSRRTIIWSVILGIIVVGCGDGEQRSGMDVMRGKDPAPGKDTPEIARKHAMQAMTVTDEYRGSAEVTSATIEATIRNECWGVAHGFDTGGLYCGIPAGSPTGCVEGRQYEFCVNAAMLDLARGNEAIFPRIWSTGGCGYSLPIVPAGLSQGPYRILPLSPAQKLEIIAIARTNFVVTLGGLAKNLAWGECSDANLDSDPAASAMVDAYRGLEELTDLAVEAELAAAETEMASTPDTTLAVWRSMTSPLLSRASAVTWLVGGAVDTATDRLLTFPGAVDGFCNLPRLSPQAEVALAALREAAPAPSAILAIPSNGLVPAAGEISIGDLLNRRGLATGSVLERLEHVWNTTITDLDIAARLGVDQKAFIDARAYLAQEIKAFARPLDSYTNPGDPAQFWHYTATANPSSPRSTAYYAAIARSAPTITPNVSWYNDIAFDTWNCATTMIPLTMSGHGYGLDRIRENMLNYVNCVEYWNGAEHVAPLIAIRTAIEREQRETIAHEFHLTSGVIWDYNTVTITRGAVPARGYRLVRGEAALECLTLGSIDGVNCGTKASSGLPSGSWNVCDLTINSSGNYSCTLYPPGEDTGTWYLLRSHSAASWVPGAAPHWDTALAQWEPVTGFQPHLTNSGAPNPLQGRTIPVYSDIEERVAKILRPSRSWCTKPERNCLGLREDDPMPLENELSTDGGSSENSWKYYLGMAKDAAIKSDELAAQYFDSALSVDQLKVDQDRFELNTQEQAMAKMEELQRICGTAISTSDLLSAIGAKTGFKMKTLYNGNCDGTESAATSIYACVASRRVISFSKLIQLHPNLASLKTCVDELSSSSSTVDLVHLGDADLCVPDAAKNNTCGGTTNPCPATRIATSQSCSVGETLVPARNGLAFFSTTGESTTSDGPEVCTALRAQRTSRSGTFDSKLSASAMLNALNMNDVGKLLKYEAQPGGYVTVRGPAGILYTTGSTISGPSTTTTGGLGCTNCLDEAQRETTNKRLLMAYLAAKQMTWRTGDPAYKVMIPSYLTFNTLPDKQYSDDYIQFKRWNGTSWTSTPLHRISGARWQVFMDESGVLTSEKMWLGQVVTRTGQGAYAVNWTPKNTVAGSVSGAFAFQTRDITPTGVPLFNFFNGFGGTSGNGCFKSALTGASTNSLGFGCDTIRYTRNFSIWSKTGSGETPSPYFAYKSMENTPFADCSGPGWGNGICVRDGAPNVNTSSSQAWAEAWDTYATNGPNGTPGFYPPDSGEGFPLAWGPEISMEFNNDPNSAAAAPYFDGLELLCDAAAQSGSAVDCGAAPPPLRSVDDLGQTGEYMECLGRKISVKGATAVFKGIPTAVLDPLRSSTGSVYSTASGELGQELEELKIALLDTYKAQQTMGHVVRQFGSEMKALQSTMRAFVDDAQISKVQFEATRVREITSCIEAVSNLAGTNNFFNPGSVGAAAAHCANSLVQIKFADQMRELALDKHAAESETAIARFDQSFDEKSQILDSQSTDLGQSLYRVNQHIGRIADLRSAAYRVLADATWLLSNDSVSTANVRTATDNRKAIYGMRYRAAVKNAKTLAFLAKRAVEQRLGLHLDSMLNDLPLVEAPARWEGALCFGNLHGLDYEWLSSPSNARDAESSSQEATSQLFTGGFIGDYVNKLENVVESYRLVNGFQEGRDTAVVSLRDDILNVRQPCVLPSRNLLVSTDDLTPKQYGPLAAGKGWFIAGCNETLAGNIPGQSPPNCVNLAREATTFRPGGAEVDVPTYRMTFGGVASGSPCAGIAAASCGYLVDSRLAQTVHLKSGDYALTWYQQRNSELDESVIEAYFPTNAALQVVHSSNTITFSGTWSKRAAIFTLTEEGDVVIGFRKGQYTDCGNAGNNPAIWAAPMLEELDKAQMTPSPGYFPSVGKYDLTDANGLARHTSCEDKDGSAFRKKWTGGCVKLCPDGYSNNCSGFAKEACYREIAFPMSQWGIDSNQQFIQSGFARGNFNYRINRLGLNFVGTGLRDCSNSTLTQTCFSGGFVNYSLAHQGPYAVRNHMGTDFLASLFEGRIEHARGVAAERYVTNPISTTDKSLLEDYMRQEMSGRPLSGTFVLRVWDDPNLDFDAIEDIQLVLEYGYWTRLGK